MKAEGQAHAVTDNGEASLAAALADAKRRYADDNPQSRTAFERAAEWMPGGNTRTILFVDPFPLYFDSGEGSTLVDVDQHRYIDFLGEYTAGLFGHSNPRILETLGQVAEDGLNFGGHNRHEAKLAALLCDRFPALDKVRFTNSGTEANLMALGAARVFTGRDKIMVFAGGYHGGVLTFGAVNRVNVPFDYITATYNDIAGTRALLRQHGGEIAAVIVEPMLQSGGCVPAELAFLEMLGDETKASGALLIFDEVVTSRLHPNAIHGKFGLTPDLVTLGKYIGGGMTFGAFGGRSDVMARFDPRLPNFVPHAGTFNNNTLSMAIGYVAMSEIFTAERAIALNGRGEALRARLNTLAADAQANMQFTGLGSVMNIHMTTIPIVSADQVKAGDMALRELFYFYLISRGIYLARRGMISLSLAITDEQIEQLVSVVSEFIDLYRPMLVRRILHLDPKAAHAP